MKLRRLDTDMKHLRDLLGRLPFSDELQYLALARCQVGTVPSPWRRASVYDCLRCARADVQATAPHFLYSVDQVVRSLALLDEAPYAHLERFTHETRVVDAREQDDGTGGGKA